MWRRRCRAACNGRATPQPRSASRNQPRQRSWRSEIGRFGGDQRGQRWAENVDTVGVTGSIPVSPTLKPRICWPPVVRAFLCPEIDHFFGTVVLGRQVRDKPNLNPPNTGSSSVREHRASGSPRAGTGLVQQTCNTSSRRPHAVDGTTALSAEVCRLYPESTSRLPVVAATLVLGCTVVARRASHGRSIARTAGRCWGEWRPSSWMSTTADVLCSALPSTAGHRPDQERQKTCSRSPIRCAAASTSAGRQRVDMRANIAEYLRPFSVGWTAVVSAGGYRLRARVSVVTRVEASRGRHAGT